MPSAQCWKSICGWQFGISDRRYGQPNTDNRRAGVAPGGSHQRSAEMTGNSRHLSRRSINALIAGAAAWPCSGAASPILSTMTIKRLLLSILEKPGSAYAIGSAYLASLPPGARAADHLINAIVCAAGCDAGTMPSNRSGQVLPFTACSCQAQRDG